MASSSSRSGVSICCQFILLILQVYVQMVEGSEVTLLVVEGASEYHQPTVTLICNGGSGGPIGFFVAGEHGTARNVTLPGNENIGNELTIDIDVTNEGVYFCAVGDQISNMVPLVAIPFVNPDIVRSYSARLGENVALPCTIPIGPLQMRYSVKWFKGLTEVDTTPHIRHNSTTLEFNGVMVSDDSRAYFCEVNVSRREGFYHRRGATVALNVVDNLRLVRGLSSKSVQVGKVANFTCHASGVPAPQFKWLLNGSEIATGVSGTNETRTSTIYVESSLALSTTTIQHTGPVTCLAYHERDGQIITVTSTANLVVLTDNFEIDLGVFNDEVRVQGTLPVPIAGFFSLQLRFSNSMGGVELNTISDPSLADTDKINVVVPREKLPSFNSFRVSVAIMSNDEIGPFTVSSNMLSLPSNFKGSCPDCDVGSYVAVVAVLVVLLVLMVLILILVIAFCYYKKDVKTSRSREYTMSPRATMSRSTSRNSCGSHKSALSYRSSRSRSCSSQSAHGSEDSHSASRYVSTPVPGSRTSPRVSPDASLKASPGIAVEPENVMEAPKDIRDYETIDHKMLKQWQEQRVHPDTRLGGSCERVAPAPVRVNEPVFPRTHIGVPNPHQQRDSDSSFEDLGPEYMELSMGAPKSC